MSKENGSKKPSALDLLQGCADDALRLGNSQIRVIDLDTVDADLVRRASLREISKLSMTCALMEVFIEDQGFLGQLEVVSISSDGCKIKRSDV